MALVAGGACNIGRAVALAFAHAGADVVARTPAQVDETVTLLRRPGATGVACDLRDPEVAFALAVAERALGPIDVLVNAVGGSATMPTLLPDDGARPDVALWRDILELNLLTVVHACAAAARRGGRAAGDDRQLRGRFGRVLRPPPGAARRPPLLPLLHRQGRRAALQRAARLGARRERRARQHRAPPRAGPAAQATCAGPGPPAGLVPPSARARGPEDAPAWPSSWRPLRRPC